MADTIDAARLGFPIGASIDDSGVVTVCDGKGLFAVMSLVNFLCFRGHTRAQAEEKAAAFFRREAEERAAVADWEASG